MASRDALPSSRAQLAMRPSQRPATAPATIRRTRSENSRPSAATDELLAAIRVHGDVISKAAATSHPLAADQPCPAPATRSLKSAMCAAGNQYLSVAQSLNRQAQLGWRPARQLEANEQHQPPRYLQRIHSMCVVKKCQLLNEQDG